MKILGLQKTTLIDYPGQIACTIFLYGCNFRCGFCHNPGLVLSPQGKEHSEQEILDFLKNRKKYIEAICITGGEPLMTLEKEFVQKIKDLGYLVKIDTNGSFPEKLKELVNEGLIDFVAMDIKGNKEDYSKIAGACVDINKIEESIKLISKMPNYEFRTTILSSLHPKEKVVNMINWVYSLCGKKIKNFALQGFKKEDELLNNDFLSEINTTERYLKELRELINNKCENLEIKI